MILDKTIILKEVESSDLSVLGAKKVQYSLDFFVAFFSHIMSSFYSTP